MTTNPFDEDADTLVYKRRRRLHHRVVHHLHFRVKRTRAHHAGGALLGGWWLDSLGMHQAAFLVGLSGTLLMFVAAFIAEEET